MHTLETDAPASGDTSEESSPTVNSDRTGNADTASRRQLLQVLGAGGLAGLAGCSQTPGGGTETGTGDGGGDGAGTATETEQPLQQSATIALPTPPVTPQWELYGNVRPYYTRVVEPLVWVTDGMELEPWLATDWEATGETTWEFTIRQDVTFHNGDPLTADEVVFSFKQQKAGTLGFVNLEKKGIRATGDLTVEFENTSPLPVFPGAIAHNAFAVQHPDAAGTKHEVIGTGPYQVDAIEPDQFLRTVAFEEYWNGSPTTPELTYRSIVDANTRVLSLQNHEIDVAFDPPSGKIRALRQSDDIDVVTQTTPRVGYFGMNIHKPPIDDADLRRALNYAVDQELIVENVLDGIGEPAKGPIAKMIEWSAHDSLPDYGPDKEKARELVERSDYDGEQLKLGVSVKRTGNKLLAETFKQMASEIGVNINVQLMEEAAYDELIRSGDFHLRLMENGTRSGSADYILFDIYHTDGFYNAAGKPVFNYGGRVDELIAKGRRAMDDSERVNAYEKAIHLIMDNAVIVPIYYKEYVVATRSDVEEIDFSPISFMVRWDGLRHLKG